MVPELPCGTCNLLPFGADFPFGCHVVSRTPFGVPPETDLGLHILKTDSPDIRHFFSDRCWIETRALDQLRHTAALPGMRCVVGLPDLHPGKGGPIGSAFFNESRVYPHLVGNDVGCGMALTQTSLTRRKLKLDRWYKKLAGLEEPWEGDRTARLARYGVEPRESDLALGTIGGGNHFAELQAIAKIADQDAFAALGLEEDRLFILVHSGSRSLGEVLMRQHVAEHGAEGLVAGSPQAESYLKRHDLGVRWAQANRALITQRFAEYLQTESHPVLDSPHNSVTPVELEGIAGWLHRKGAAPSDRGALVIPGSRGTLSYLVAPLGDQVANAYSVAHGAGRKWTRSDSRARLSDRYRAEDLTHTRLGGRVICEDRDLLYEEAPEAYKNIDAVISELVEREVIKVIATLKPVLTYKTRREADAYREQR